MLAMRRLVVEVKVPGLAKHPGQLGIAMARIRGLQTANHYKGRPSTALLHVPIPL